MTNALLWALGGTGFTFLMTSLGAALVFLFSGTIGEGFRKALLGFAAGVMIAASIFSLLIPAIAEAESVGVAGWIPAAGGFLFGVGALMMLNRLTRNLRALKTPDGTPLKQTTLLVTAITLHNIPEGMAVGLSFARAAQNGGDAALYAASLALCFGVGIQNFPEGAAVSLPLRQEGTSKFKAFLAGSLSGIVEPVFGALTVLAASRIEPMMPWLLSAAAGAMMYVVVEELIPQAHLEGKTNPGTLGAMGGFILMMILDLALG